MAKQTALSWMVVLAMAEVVNMFLHIENPNSIPGYRRCDKWYFGLHSYICIQVFHTNVYVHPTKNWQSLGTL